MQTNKNEKLKTPSPTASKAAPAPAAVDKKEDISRLENDGWTPDTNTECSVQLDAARKLFWDSLNKAETYLGASSTRPDFEVLRKFIQDTKEELEKIAGPAAQGNTARH